MNVASAPSAPVHHRGIGQSGMQEHRTTLGTTCARARERNRAGHRRTTVDRMARGWRREYPRTLK